MKYLGILDTTLNVYVHTQMEEIIITLGLIFEKPGLLKTLK